MWLDALPLWGVLLFTALLAQLAVEVGYRIGRIGRRAAPHTDEGPLGAMVGATMGLLAFLLGFTFSAAASRFESRRILVLDEANAIGTTYLRTDFLIEPHRAEVRKLLREYVDVRLNEGGRSVDEAIRESETLQVRLWKHAAAVGDKNRNSIVVGLFVQSLNEVIDLHAKRVMIGMRSRLPNVIWTVLYIITALGLAALGYLAGLSGANRSWPMWTLCLAIATVMSLIADLDRPQQGFLKVSQRPLVDVRNSMTEPQP